MATLSGNKIKNTYQSLVKFSDNGNITTSAKQLTDGFGNNSPMFVSTTQVGIGVTPEAGLNLHVFGDAKIGSNLTVIGNLVVEGSTTTVGTDTLTVKDPLIVLANNNTSTDAVDIGFYGKYHPSDTTLYSGLFREALTGKYRLFKGLEVEPTTTVNTSGTGYAVASLVANLEGNVTGNLIGSVTGGTFSGTLLTNVTATTQSAGDNSTKVATTAYVDSGLAGQDTLAEILANENTTGGTDIAVSAGDDITFVDNSKAIFGTDSDLQIYHDDTNGYINNTTGGLIVSAPLSMSFRVNTNEFAIACAANSSVELFHDNNVRLTTTGSGVEVTGDVDFTGNINIGDNQKILFGDSGDVEMFFNGSTFVIDDTVEVFGFDIDTNLIRFRGTDLYTEISNTQHTFWTSGTERFKINSTEVKVSHQLNVVGDLIVDTDTLFVDVSTDSVGINTSNPSAYDNNALVVTVPDNGGITIASGTDEQGRIEFSDDADGGLENYILCDHDGDILGYNAWGSHQFTVGEGVPSLFLSNTSTTVKENLIVDGNSTFSGNVTTTGLMLSTNAAPVLEARSTSGTQNSSLILTNIATLVGTAAEGLKLYYSGSTGHTFLDSYYSNGNINFRTKVSGTPITALLLSAAGNATFANRVSAGESFNSVKDGADTVADGPFFALKNAAGTRQYINQLDASNNIDYWYYNGSTWTQTISLLNDGGATFSGNVGIGVSSLQSWAKLQVAGTAGAQTGANQALYVTAPSTTAGEGVGIRLSAASGSNEAVGIIGMVNNASGNAGSMTFHTYNGGADVPERMRIDNSGTTTITNGTNDNTLLLLNGARGRRLRIEEHNTGNGGIAITSQDDNETGTTNSNNRTILLNASGGNVGIGTNSPFTNLEVAGSGADSIIRLYASGGTANIRTWEMRAVGVAGEGLLFRQVNDANNSYTNRMIIDTDGNVGIGTISPDYTLHLLKSSGDTEMYINGQNGQSSIRMGLDARNWQIKTAAAPYLWSLSYVGTDFQTSNIITAKTTGNVGIGNDSPSAKLTIDNSISTSYTTTGYAATPSNSMLYLNNTNGGSNTASLINFRTGSGDGVLGFVEGGGTNNADFVIQTDGGSNGIERFRITNDGNVGINASASLRFNGAGDNTHAVGYDSVIDGSFLRGQLGVRFLTGTGGGTERMRITSGGEVLIRRASSTNTTYSLQVGDSVSDSYRPIRCEVASTATRTQIAFHNPGQTAPVGAIQTYSLSTSYTTGSDYRLKENVVEMTGALDRVSQLKPSRFNFIADADKTVDGFLAHEVQEIVPEAITGQKDGMRTEEYEISPDVYEDVIHPSEEAVYETIEHPSVEEELDDEGNVIVEGKEAYTEEVLVTEAKEEWTEKVLVTEKVMGTREVPDYQGIDQSKLVPLLVGAIQELKAEIESLKLQINN